jgi:hypothetical protein
MAVKAPSRPPVVVPGPDLRRRQCLLPGVLAGRQHQRIAISGSSAVKVDGVLGSVQARLTGGCPQWLFSIEADIRTRMESSSGADRSRAS